MFERGVGCGENLGIRVLASLLFFSPRYDSLFCFRTAYVPTVGQAFRGGGPGSALSLRRAMHVIAIVNVVCGLTCAELALGTLVVLQVTPALVVDEIHRPVFLFIHDDDRHELEMDVSAICDIVPAWFFAQLATPLSSWFIQEVLQALGGP